MGPPHAVGKAAEAEGGVVVGRKHKQTAEGRVRVKQAAKAICDAHPVFLAMVEFRSASETWQARAVAFIGACDVAERLALIAQLAEATSAYIAASGKARRLAPAAVHSALDEAAHYASAFVLDGKRHARGIDWPIADAYNALSTLWHDARGVARSSMMDVAWGAAWSAVRVSFVEAVDGGRATELDGMLDADIAEARRLAGVGKGFARGVAGDNRKNDADTVSSNRRTLDDRKREWLSADGDSHAIALNEALAERGDRHAISAARPRRKRR